MFAGAVLLVLLALAAIITFQARCALAKEGVVCASLLMMLVGGAWGLLELSHRTEPLPPEDQTASRPVNSQSCRKCHEGHYTSWQRTYHSTMTREAEPQFIKATFDGAPQVHRGVTSHMIREGDRFYLETADPKWVVDMAARGVPLDKAGTAPRIKISVDRVVGSHWFQQFLHRDEHGRYVRMPLAYHIVEQRWLHIDGVFLAPDENHFFSKVFVWNNTCVYCHNTRPSKNPMQFSDGQTGFRTEVTELGIACEACHGAAERHVKSHANPARRLAQRYADAPDPTIVNPARLSVQRADDICAHCHGRMLRRPEMWDHATHADPYLAGRDLGRFNYLYWSEAQMHARLEGREASVSWPQPPAPDDGQFWGDGTPMTTGVEYQGMALSACYQNGQGKMSCLSCHSMHHSDPNHQVKEGMRTNAACYGCHEDYRARLVAHTHHAADSPGSLCANCHMPYQVFSLLDTHRAHRITVPRVRDSIGTGKPHACNLCHLDKSLGWTSEQLAKRYGTRPEPLAENERTVASSVLHLAQGDARTRAVVAGAFGWASAQDASGRDWAAPLLLSALDHERYQAVRYLLHRSLRSLGGHAADAYDYQAEAGVRVRQVQALRVALERPTRPDRARYPYLPLTAAGQFADDAFARLLRDRNDPDVSIHE